MAHCKHPATARFRVFQHAARASPDRDVAAWTTVHRLMCRPVPTATARLLIPSAGAAKVPIFEEAQAVLGRRACPGP